MGPTKAPKATTVSSLSSINNSIHNNNKVILDCYFPKSEGVAVRGKASKLSGCDRVKVRRKCDCDSLRCSNDRSQRNDSDRNNALPWRWSFRATLYIQESFPILNIMHPHIDEVSKICSLLWKSASELRNDDICIASARRCSIVTRTKDVKKDQNDKSKQQLSDTRQPSTWLLKPSSTSRDENRWILLSYVHLNPKLSFQCPNRCTLSFHRWFQGYRGNNAASCYSCFRQSH